VGVGGRWGGRLFEAGRLLTFSAFRMGAYSRWALIRGWALIRINTVPFISLDNNACFPTHFPSSNVITGQCTFGSVDGSVCEALMV